MPSSTQEIMRLQERKLDKLGAKVIKQNEQLNEFIAELKALRTRDEENEKKIRALMIGSSFRQLMEMSAEMVIPFHYIVDIVVPITATNRVLQPLQTTSKGWFFADRVFGSYRPTTNNGGAVGQYRPLTHADPTVAAHDASGVGVAVPNVLEFSWEYSENRTNMARQNDSLTIPGDLLFRRDGDGFLLGGDPWAPRTTITPGITPRVSPVDAGVFTFTFLGALCLNTKETAVQAWLERQSLLKI